MYNAFGFTIHVNDVFQVPVAKQLAEYLRISSCSVAEQDINFATLNSTWPISKGQVTMAKVYCVNNGKTLEKYDTLIAINAYKDWK
jgi:hypothetical protein